MWTQQQGHPAVAARGPRRADQQVREASPWLTQRYTYPHADVELNFFRVYAWSGEPVGHDGQAFRWQTPGRFDVSPLLPANTMVLRALELPTVYGITRAAVVGTAAFLLRARAALALDLRAGSWWVVVDGYNLARMDRPSGRLLTSIARVTDVSGVTVITGCQSGLSTSSNSVSPAETVSQPRRLAPRS